MRFVTFNKIYAALLLVAIASVLANPKSLTDKARAQLQRLFTPVSLPARYVSLKVYERLSPPRADGERPSNAQRSYQQIADENRDLRVEVARLTEQLRRLERLNADRESLGALREVSRPMSVAGKDTGWRKALSLQGEVEGIKPGMAVLYPGGLVGKIDRVGWSMGAQAQLITDSTFRLLARFGRLEQHDGQTGFRLLTEMPTLLEGNGRDGMVARQMAEKDAQAAGLKPGDFAVVADDDYPDILQGFRVGMISAIVPSRSPQYVEIRIAPAADLLSLSEVMVLLK